MTVLEEIIEKINKLPESKRKELEKSVMEQTGHMKHVPSPGPQTQAYFTKADITLYGGQAGGGKSALVVLLALQEHRRSLIMRRQFTDLGAIIEDCLQKYGSRQGYSGASPARLRTTDGRLLEFGAAKLPGDEESWQGQAHDLLALDEATQFLESQVRFLSGWVRPGPGVPEDQKCRIVLATNPPMSPAQGQWVREWFAPWLDEQHPLYPAEAGKLLWRISDAEGRFRWVENSDPVETGGKMVQPESLTYIPAKLSDNPFLKDTNYASKLDAMDEPKRSAIRDGNWMIAFEDDMFQVIPTAWVMAAQDRWTRDPPKDAPMCSMGVDVARGGAANTVIQPRYDTWFADPIAAPGKDTPSGQDTAALIIKHRKHNSEIVIDMGGGYGGSVWDHLESNLGFAAESLLHAFDGSKPSSARTRDRHKGFYNRRAEAWWKMREALDPDQEGGSPIMLPPNQDLLMDLIAPRFDDDNPRGIKIEAKSDVIKRLGRSPDFGDACVMSWSVGKNYTSHGQIWRSLTKTMGRPFKVTTTKYKQRKRR